MGTMEAMMAKGYKPEKFKPGMLGSVKLDGLRCLYAGGKCYTRNGNRIAGVEHIEKALKSNSFGDLDGEILIPEMTFDQSTGQIRSRNGSPDAKYFVFGSLETGRPFSDVYRGLKEQFERRHLSTSIAAPTTITLVEHTPLRTAREVQAACKAAIAAGYEGLMLKTPDHYYQPGKRSSDWLKLKPELSKDLAIEAFFEGNGRLEGTLGGVIVKHGSVSVRVGAGFTDRQREKIWRKQKFYAGKIVEVTYQEETEAGSLRHPRFKTFRFDKETR